MVNVDFLRKVFDVKDGDEISALPILVSELRFGQHVVVDDGHLRYWGAFNESDGLTMRLGGPGHVADLLSTSSDGSYDHSDRFKTIKFDDIHSIYRLV